MKNFFSSSKGNPSEDPGKKAIRAAGETHEESFLSGDELRDRKNVQLLLEAIGEVSSTLSLESLLIDIVDKSIELTRAERGLLLLEKDGKVQIRVARGSKKETLIPPIQYSTTLAQQVANTRKSLRKMVSSDSQAVDLGQSVFDLKLRAVMCAPLMVKDRLIGVIYVDSRAAEREFSKIDLAFFNALSRQLAIAMENARLVADSVEKARLQQEIQIASDIQKGLLPEKPPEIPGVELFGWYTPCEAATGDSYDLYPLSGNRVGLILGDVSGHGIGPALLAATARAALRAYLTVVPDLSQLNQFLYRDLQRDLKDGMFMTLFLGIYHVESQCLDYVNAGHPSPLILRNTGKAEVLEGFEPAFGMKEEASSGALQTKLNRGDLLLVFSDGLVEARSRSGEFFGEEKLKKALERNHGRSVKEIVESVVSEVLRFTDNQRGDDLTLFALRVQ